MYRTYIPILFIIQNSYKYIIFSIKFIYDSNLRMIMNFKNIHMMAILTATLMVSSAVGYMLVQEAQANVNANGGNANGGNADGGPGIAGLKDGNSDAEATGRDGGTGGNGAPAGSGGIALCITDDVPC